MLPRLAVALAAARAASSSSAAASVLRPRAPAAAAALARGFAANANANANAASAATTTTKAVKRTTGIVGLPVDPQAREKLKALYRDTLAETAKLEPKHKAFREFMDKTTKYRLAVVESSEFTDEEVEDVIAAGQLEQLVRQAQDALNLVRTFPSLLP